MQLIGVDIGGTFTDVVFADTETNDIRIHKVPTTPRRSVARDAGRGARALRARGYRPGRGRTPVPRHHHRHQRDPHPRGRAHRDDHQRGLPRHRPHRAPPAAPALLDSPGDPVAGPAVRAPPPPPHGARAHYAAGGRNPHPARRGGGTARGPPAPGRRRGGDRGVLPVLLDRPGPRGAGRGHRARGAPGLLRDHVGVRIATVPGVRAVHHHRDERVHRTAGARLHGPDWRPHEGGGRLGGAPRHELQRRRGDGAHGLRAAGRHPALGAGGRGPRRAVVGRALRTAQAHHLRHGRYVGGYRHRR